MAATVLASRQEIAPVQRNRAISFYLDEMFVPPTSTGNIVSNNSGTGATQTQQVGESGAPGVISLDVGTGTTNRTCIQSLTMNKFLPGGGEIIVEARIRLSAVSDATNTYTVRMGLSADMGGDGANGCYFRYTHGTNSGNWQGVCRKASTESVVNGSVAPVTSGWQRLTMIINPGATSVDFQINGTSIGTVTTNIPNTAGQEIGFGLSMLKALGTTSRSIYCDFVGWQLTFTTGR